VIYSINWIYCVYEFIIKSYDNYKNIERIFQPLIILVNSVYNYFENYTEEEILNINCPLVYFIKKSFGNILNIF
jgi:hypothetical protein